MKCCILHQKLQMLNCSILHKIKHQPQRQQQEEGSTPNYLTPPTNTSPSPASRTHHQSLELQHTPSSTTASGERGGEREGEGTYPQQEREVPTRPISDSNSRLLPREEEKEGEGGRSSNDEESDDEFFEALEDHEEEEDVGDPTSPPLQRELGDRKEEEEEREGRREREREVEREGQGTGDKPDGRLQLCGDLVLIATGEPMYIPVTQVSLKTPDLHLLPQESGSGI